MTDVKWLIDPDMVVFRTYKIVQTSNIPISISLSCPHCDKSNCYGSQRSEPSTLIGWCESQTGYMMVFECPICFHKYRCHNCTTERDDLLNFAKSFNLALYLQETKD